MAIVAQAQPHVDPRRVVVLLAHRHRPTKVPLPRSRRRSDLLRVDRFDRHPPRRPPWPAIDHPPPPRKAKSSWSRLNRQRAADMERRGLMTDAGRAAIDAAKANGWWTSSDQVEDLEEPADLTTALDRNAQARANWDNFPPSARKQMLWWIISANRLPSRSRRSSARVGPRCSFVIGGTKKAPRFSRGAESPKEPPVQKPLGPADGMEGLIPPPATPVIVTSVPEPQLQVRGPPLLVSTDSSEWLQSPQVLTESPWDMPRLGGVSRESGRSQ